MNYQLEAIILKEWDAKGFDRFYEIFSKEKGKVNVIAKGVRKSNARLAGGMEPITYSKVYLFKGKRVDRLIGVLVLEQFLSIKQNLGLIGEVQKASWILRNFLGEQEPNEKIFQLFLNYLKRTDKKKSKNNLQFLFFLWCLIKESGYQFQLVRCIHCNKKLAINPKHFFSFKRGVICPKCASQERQKIEIYEESIKLLRVFQQGKTNLIEKLKVEEKTRIQLMLITKNILENLLNKQVYL